MQKIKNINIYCIGFTFIFFVVISCYKLTNASLWYDETIEYWYSKVVIGTLPFDDRYTNMYQRIVSTFQPPLYNLLMYLWLKILDTEWWFRFFGIVMGFISMLGTYKVVKNVSNSIFFSCSAVIFATCIPSLLYRWQECAEYNLMLASLSWTIYFWVILIKEIRIRNIILFTISCCVSVYGQYGAIFPVFAMVVTAGCVVLFSKEIKKILAIMITYLSAFVFVGIPLYIFFIREQINQQHSGEVNKEINSFNNGFLKDIFRSYHTVFEVNFSLYFDVLAWVILIILSIIYIFVFIKGNRITRLLVIVNVITWLSYYTAVKTNIYAGAFGNRYNLFFIPLWIVTLFLVDYELYRLLSNNFLLARKKLHVVLIVATTCVIICYCSLSWYSVIQKNWKKEDIRGTVNAWYSINACDKDTLVYYGADSGFAYYIRHNDRYRENMEDKVMYMPWYRDGSQEQYKEYIMNIWDEKWPDEVYLVGSHIHDNEFDTLVNVFILEDFYSEEIFNADGGRLVKLIK